MINIPSKLVAIFASNPNKKYPIVVGSTFSESYSEELDAANIIISQVSENDRLSNIKPYDYVRIVEDLETSNFNKLYLVDNFSERLDCVENGNKFFSYTIGLFSETKLLEKIQCPNLTITHELDSEGNVVKLTIYEHICRYMDLYIPRIKLLGEENSWSYQPIIEIPGKKEEVWEDKTTYVVFNGPFEREHTYTQTFELPINPSIDVNGYRGDLKGGSAYIEEGRGFDPTTIHSTIEGAKITISISTGRTTPEGGYSDSIKLKVSYKEHIIVFKPQNDNDTRLFNRFNVSCADLPLTNPTFRQLLTSLMQQVGCIPVVRGGKLTFLDFKNEAEPITNEETGDWLNNTITNYQRSLSSDSYVNRLATYSVGVLDSENSVISEKLGFRDSSSVLLKQQQNLHLETKLPIYKVNKCVINIPLSVNKSWNEDVWESFYYTNSDGGQSQLLSCIYAGADYKIHIKTQNTGFNSIPSKFISYAYNIDNGVLLYVKNSTEECYKEIETITPNYDTDIPISDEFEIEGGLADFFNNKLAIFVKAIYSLPDGSEKIVNLWNGRAIIGYTSQDITPLIKESNERNLLDRDFTAMGNAETIEEISKYIYSTFYFTIGGKSLNGFSESYSQLVGWWQESKTYIENIVNFIFNHYFDENKVQYLGSKIEIFNHKGEVVLREDVEISKDVNFTYNYVDNFALYTFDLDYQPLNTMCVAYDKTNEDVVFPLEQLSSSANGISDFDRLSLNEQEQVNRIGNETISIAQRTTDFNDVCSFTNEDGVTRPLYYDKINGDTKYIIFKKTVSVGNNCLQTSYMASKDAILKNYFTSIRTKYRAFQYVDYSQSVLRKEKTVIYVRIGFDALNGDDLFVRPSYMVNYHFIGLEEPNPTLKINYSFEQSKNAEGRDEICKNDVSVYTTQNLMCLTFENSDNVSAGPTIKSTLPELGGINQKFQFWGKEYYRQHKMGYLGNLGQNFVDNTISYNEIIKLPIITNATPYPIFSIRSFGEESEKVYYKDNAEVINQTIQFHYYATPEAKDYIEWTELFIKNNSFVNSANINELKMVFNDDKELSDEYYERDEVSDYDDNMIGLYAQDDGTSYIQINWTQDINSVTIVDRKNNLCRDIVRFKKKNDDKDIYYISLNDTKTDIVMKRDNDGFLYPYKKAKTGVLERKVVD